MSEILATIGDWTKSSDSPFFVYSERELESSAERLRAFWNRFSRPGYRLYFSVKSNPNAELLRSLATWVDGFDVSSLAEARLVRQTLPRDTRLTWSGPAKTPGAIATMEQLTPTAVHVDSLDEWIALGSRALPRSLRLQLSQVPGHKLGFSSRELERLQTWFKTDPSRLGSHRLMGLHAYLGRESFSRQNFTDALKEFDSAFNSHSDWFQANEIYLGAGLPMPSVINAHPETFDAPPSPTHLVHLECGRALVQACGYYATRVLAVKTSATPRTPHNELGNLSDGATTVILDGGLQHMASHLLSPKYQAEGVEIAFFRDGREQLDKARTFSLQGSLSLWHDVLIASVNGPTNLRRGDWIVAKPVGAYGWTAACNQFLGPSAVREYLLSLDGGRRDVTPPHLRTYQLSGSVL